jgi:hypothetical protein
MMIWLHGAASLFRDVDPDRTGFQASWFYVLICLLCPAVLGVLMATLTAAIGRLVVRRRGKGGGRA